MNGIASGGIVLRRRSSIGSMPSFGRRLVDHALDYIGEFGPAVAAIGPHRVGVGEHGGHLGMDRRGAVDAGQGAEVHHEDVRVLLRISAGRGDRADPEGEEMPVIVERQLGLGDMVARLRVAEEGLRAGAGPFDRPAEQLRGQQHQRDLVVDRRFHAEAAADIAGDDADPALRHVQDLRQVGAVGVGALQCRVDRVAAVGRVVVADRAARLHRRRGHPVDDEPALDDAGGAAEGGLDRRLVADLVDEADVVRAVVPDARRIRARSPPRSTTTAGSGS